MSPRQASLYAGLGASRLAQGQDGQAADAYRRATQLAPRNSGYFSALGRAYRGAGNASAARTAYRRALALDPNNQSAQRGLESL
jgi:Flp pilus assembly protein TadD